MDSLMVPMLLVFQFWLAELTIIGANAFCSHLGCVVEVPEVTAGIAGGLLVESAAGFVK